MNSSQTLKLNDVDASTLGLPNLAFAGKPGSGKTTAIRFLCDELGFWLGDEPTEAAPVTTECCCERRWWELSAQGFVFVRLVCEDSRRYQRLLINEPAPDLDQTEKMKADHTIENDGSKYDLYDELMNVLVKERKKR